MEKKEISAVETNSPPPPVAPRAIAVSSTATLFWRVFIPVFGTVFLLGLCVALWLVEKDDSPGSPLLPLLWVRLLATVLLLGWLFFLSRTLWRLKRVDADSEHIYVTNYWTTVRYPWADVERLESKRRLGRRVVNLWLKAPGRFGRIISFLPASHFDTWLAEHGKEGLFSKT